MLILPDCQTHLLLKDNLKGFTVLQFKHPLNWLYRYLKTLVKTVNKLVIFKDFSAGKTSCKMYF